MKMKADRPCYNDQFRERTKIFTINLCRAFDDLPYKESTRMITRQILRSGASVAANFRAAGRARSPAEYYSKLCIVVEECDETVFWLELIGELLSPANERIIKLHKETGELLRVFSATKRKLKEKLKK
jgi:four helix bundle protein